MTRILVADDEEDILESTKLLLETMGYDVEAVAHGDGIFDRAQETTPDLILQDFHMPGVEVGALIRRLRDEPATARTPVILFTATLEEEYLWRVVGADGLLRKPFETDQIRDVIKQFTGRRPVGAS